MDLNKALKLVRKLATPHTMERVFVDATGDVVMQNRDGDDVSDDLYKEFDAIKFKEEHALAPRKWRTYAGRKTKEF
jgi:hypothetical protein